MQLEILALLDLKGLPELQVTQDQLDQLVPQVLLEIPDPPDQQVPQEQTQP